ncbi:hypothetical protein DN389_07665 [Bacillus sp. AY3-1]|nr:hypothetical protein DN389_07665 [Bacillus sp. AY3-1]
MRLTFFAFLLKENILYLKLYPRFFKYIYRNLQYIHDSTRNIDLPTNFDIEKYFMIKRLPKIRTAPYTPLFHTSKLRPSSYII